MSASDTLHDAVAALDRYIAEQAEGSDGWGEALREYVPLRERRA